MITAPLRRRARSIFSVVVVALTVTVSLSWSDTVFARDTPFEAIITDKQVEVRAGPGRAYYVVDTLQRGDRVRVVQTLYDWSKIEAPDSSFSYISQAFVNARGDGSTGVVNSNRQEVKAGSLQGPGVSYKTQVMLNRGDEVKILETVGDYYKIEPPKNAFVYLPPGSIRPAGPRDVAPARETSGSEETGREGADENPGAPAAGEPDASVDDRAEDLITLSRQSERQTETDGEADAAEPTDDRVASMAEPDAQDGPGDAAEEEDAPSVTLSTEQRDREPGEVEIDIAKGQELEVEPETTALAELEARAIPELKKRVEEQPIEDLLAAYRSLRDREDIELNSSERQLVALRIAVLQRNRQLREALAKIEASQEAAEQSPATASNEQATEAASPERGTREAYDAVGKLLASSVYDGRSLPRMYRLVDPTARRTLAYIAPADVDTTAMLGKLVGVRGESQYDPSLKLRIFEVQSIEVLNSE
jgi:SH3-like domain-containing protein